MPPTLADRVSHVLEAIERIERALAGKTRADFEGEILLRLAVERLLEIVCEAARHIPAAVKTAEPSIAWTTMTDFGNRLRHAYHTIDVGIVWQIVQNDLPPLKAFVERIIREQSGPA